MSVNGSFNSRATTFSSATPDGPLLPSSIRDEMIAALIHEAGSIQAGAIDADSSTLSTFNAAIVPLVEELDALVSELPGFEEAIVSGDDSADQQVDQGKKDDTPSSVLHINRQPAASEAPAINIIPVAAPAASAAADSVEQHTEQSLFRRCDSDLLLQDAMRSSDASELQVHRSPTAPETPAVDITDGSSNAQIFRPETMDSSGGDSRPESPALRVTGEIPVPEFEVTDHRNSIILANSAPIPAAEIEAFLMEVHTRLEQQIAFKDKGGSSAALHPGVAAHDECIERPGTPPVSDSGLSSRTNSSVSLSDIGGDELTESDFLSYARDSLEGHVVAGASSDRVESDSKAKRARIK